MLPGIPARCGPIVLYELDDLLGPFIYAEGHVDKAAFAAAVESRLGGCGAAQVIYGDDAPSLATVRHTYGARTDGLFIPHPADGRDHVAITLWQPYP